MIKYYLLSLFLGLWAISSGQNKMYLKNGNIIDVVKGTVLKNQDVIIIDGKIESVGKTNKSFTTEGFKVIDATDQYILPGFTDPHIHFFQSGGLYTRPDAMDLRWKMPYEKERKFVNDNVDDFLSRYLRCGVTTVVDVGGPMNNYTIRDSHAHADSLPRIYVTGPLISTVDREILNAGDPPIIKAKNAAEALELVKKQLPFKPEFVKIWYVVTPEMSAESNFEIVKAVADEAHKNNIKLAVHAIELHTAKLALKAGADMLVHSVQDSVIDDEFIALMLKRKVSLVPTLDVVNNYFKSFNRQTIAETSNLRLANPFSYGTLGDMETIPLEKIPEKSRKRITEAETFRKKYAHMDSVTHVNLKKLVKAGVNVAAGTDAGNIGTMHGPSFWTELDIMKQAGLSDAEVLKTATLNAAMMLGKETIFGSVEKGKIADLLIIDKNPLENIQHVRDLKYIIRNGILMEPDNIIKETTEQLVQRQLNAYNAGNIDEFMATYSDSIVVYNHPNSVMLKGKETMRKRYQELFQKNPNQHCELVNRIVQKNCVIDQERVTGRADGKIVEAIAVYEIENKLIKNVYFIRK